MEDNSWTRYTSVVVVSTFTRRYHMLKNGQVFSDLGADYVERNEAKSGRKRRCAD